MHGEMQRGNAGEMQGKWSKLGPKGCRSFKLPYTVDKYMRVVHLGRVLGHLQRDGSLGTGERGRPPPNGWGGGDGRACMGDAVRGAGGGCGGGHAGVAGNPERVNRHG